MGVWMSGVGFVVGLGAEVGVRLGFVGPGVRFVVGLGSGVGLWVLVLGLVFGVGFVGGVWV